jgi:acetylglutamate kinase
MRLLVKIGGALLEEPAGRQRLAQEVGRALGMRHQVVLLHGGGNQMRALQQRLQIPDRYHQGLRITDPDTADVALMVLGGSVNRLLVGSLLAAGLRAVGLTGADGNLFFARRKVLPGVDLGYVGEATAFDRSLIDTLAAAGYVPVVSSVATLVPGDPGPRDRFYNINADEAAGPMAVALGCDAALFLTDVPGVLDQHKALIPELTIAATEALIRSGVIRGGMEPKVRAALGAAAAGCPLVKVLPGDAEDPILGGLIPGRGTRFLP